MMNMQMVCDKKYLLIPIAVQQPLKELTVYADGKKLYEFRIPVSEEKGAYKFQYYAPLAVEKYAGSVLSLEGDLEENFYGAVCLSDFVPEEKAPRPRIHFSAGTGWLNDPNGFFCQNGVYHLYFQHNPMNTLWENMCWGHAVSRDLLHWQQEETVMYPDEDGTIFSGCAIVNERGMLDIPAKSPVFFYTSAGNTSQWSAGKRFVQKIACSRDGGNTVEKTGIIAVPHIVGENRDPKVYWHEESNGYYMVLYLEKNEFAVLRSENLTDWIMTQQLTLEDAWECPDLVRIPVEGGGSRWVFGCADGFYFVGDFDGYTFTRTGERMQAYATALPYAAQTCWGEKRVITIPWLRSRNGNAVYTGVMGLPRELSLVEKDGRLRLCQRLIRELSDCRKKVEAHSQEKGLSVYRYNADLAAELVVHLSEGESFEAAVGETTLQYSAQECVLRVIGCFAHEGESNWRQGEITKQIGGRYSKEVKLEERPQKVSVLADHEILEITLDDGMLCAYFEVPYEGGQQVMQVRTGEGSRASLYQIS